MRRVSKRLGSVVVLALACTPTSEPTPSPEIEDPSPPAPTPEPEPPLPEPTPEPKLDPGPTLPSFDPATVTAIRVEIIRIFNRSAPRCGYLHGVGAIEVAVLGVGDPPPHMILFISCPNDNPVARELEVGARVAVTLYARKQSWPVPSGGGIPPELPRRYIETISPFGFSVDLDVTSPKG